MTEETLTESLTKIVDAWFDGLISTLTMDAAEAYAAGMFHANGVLRLGISFDVVEKEALDFAKKYRARLVNTGTITVNEFIRNDVGKVIGYRAKDIVWLSGAKRTEMRDKIAQAIENGILVGKPTGVKIDEFGQYPPGSIAADIQRITDNYKSEASTIARTETMRCAYNGEAERYRRAGVKYLKYLGGPNACPDCEDFIGKIYPLGSEPLHPMHPNCRCGYSPYKVKVGEIINSAPDEHTDGNGKISTNRA